jgi:hypothetical protein
MQLSTLESCAACASVYGSALTGRRSGTGGGGNTTTVAKFLPYESSDMDFLPAAEEERVGLVSQVTSRTNERVA